MSFGSAPSAAAIERAYDRLAPVYDLWGQLFTARARAKAHQRAALENGERFLEVGVGTGLTFAPLALGNPDGRNEGIDLSDAMLQRCSRRLARVGATNYTLRRGDVRALTFADRSFDLVICSYLLDHLSDPEIDGALGELRRVLCDGGRLLLIGSTPGGSGLARLGRLPTALLPGFRPLELGQRVIAAGFTDVSRMIYTQRLVSSELIRGLRLDRPVGR